MQETNRRIKKKVTFFRHASLLIVAVAAGLLVYASLTLSPSLIPLKVQLFWTCQAQIIGPYPVDYNAIPTKLVQVTDAYTLPFQ